MEIYKEGSDRVLLAEDGELILWSMKKYLSDRGFDVDVAADGHQALNKLTETRYDAVVTDLNLTGVDGLALTDFVRKKNPDCQVIIITGRGSKESVIGALRKGVFDYIEKPFDLEILLLTLEKALEKTRMIRELVRLSRTDGLTGLYNQRYFQEILKREINRARRKGHPLSLILADVDFLKAYNDRYGHLKGDEALMMVASSLKEACRQDVDMAFRYGGDEFMILLPETDVQEAGVVAERLHQGVEILHLEGISLSIGIAELEQNEGIKEFIRRTDEAMYLAKQRGGKRSVVFSSQN